MKETVKFKGPLFIVGMPRSGTKLLRDLLNRNSLISIPEAESHFIPYMINLFGLNLDLNQHKNLRMFYDQLLETSFYRYMKSGGKELTWETLKTCSAGDWPGIIEFVLRHFAPESGNAFPIWGDKTPGYINHLILLKKVFPQSRFIHIVRDPRDYCLSVRKTWGKNIYRAAERWRITIQQVREDSRELPEDYFEIKYEDILKNPVLELTQLCDFLSIPFSKDMTTLDKPSENLGDTRGIKEIVPTNVAKYKNQLSSNEIKRIEELVKPVAVDLFYQLQFDSVSYRPLGSSRNKLYKFYDAIAMVMFYINSMGLSKAAGFLFKNYTKSSWRTYNNAWSL